MTKAEIILVKSLAEKKGRTTSGLFMAEGEKLAGEIIASGLTVSKIFTTLNELSFPTAASVEKVTSKDMDRISNLKTPSKVIALVEIPHYKFSMAKIVENLALALDNIQDPGNMGTIIRIADWFGIRDIICSETTADCYNPKVVQASMGAITRVRVHYTTLPTALNKIAAEGVNIYGAFLEGDSIYTAQISNKGVIVMGNEGQGISEEVENTIGKKLYIPPYPTGSQTSESLNVSIATAIICSEFRRRH